MNFYEWMETAKTSMARLPPNTSFTLKDLFEGCQWNALSKGERLKFGKYFKNQVLMNELPNIQYADTPSGKSAQYRKV